MEPITKRINDTRIAAGFSYTQMQLWLKAAYSSVYCWCTGKVIPEDYKIKQITERLDWLDEAITNKELPLPLALNQKDKKTKILELLDQYERAAVTVPGGARTVS